MHRKNIVHLDLKVGTRGVLIFPSLSSMAKVAGHS